MSKYKCSKCKDKGFYIETLSTGRSEPQKCECWTPLESKKEMFMYDRLSPREKNIYEYAFDIGMQEGENYRTPETFKKSEWLEFQGAMIRKSDIIYYQKYGHVIKVATRVFMFVEDFSIIEPIDKLIQKLFERFDEIDKLIRG